MTTLQPYLSVIVPTYNERDNVIELIGRLTRTLESIEGGFELIFIDDRSLDGTKALLESLATENISVYTKVGSRGKAYSLLEGFDYAKGTIVSFIDADLQYPPEAFIPALETIANNDIVVAERDERQTSMLRRIFSSTFRFIFGKVLLGLSVDVQSGMKLIRRETLDAVELEPTAWGLDYQLLFEANRIGARIGSFPIVFSERQNGTSAINPMKVALELSLGALKLRSKALHSDVRAYFVKKA